MTTLQLIALTALSVAAFACALWVWFINYHLPPAQIAGSFEENHLPLSQDPCNQDYRTLLNMIDKADSVVKIDLAIKAVDKFIERHAHSPDAIFLYSKLCKCIESNQFYREYEVWHNSGV